MRQCSDLIFRGSNVQEETFFLPVLTSEDEAITLCQNTGNQLRSDVLLYTRRTNTFSGLPLVWRWVCFVPLFLCCACKLMFWYIDDLEVVVGLFQVREGSSTHWHDSLLLVTWWTREFCGTLSHSQILHCIHFSCYKGDCHLVSQLVYSDVHFYGQVVYFMSDFCVFCW